MIYVKIKNIPVYLKVLETLRLNDKYLNKYKNPLKKINENKE